MRETGIDIGPGRKVAILGLGISGRAAAKYCLRRGAKVLISDLREQQRLVTEEAELLEHPDVSWEAGGHSPDFMAGADLILVSPGISPELPALQTMRRRGVPIAGELQVLAPHLDCPVIAVTGTNGKTTVTSMIGHIFDCWGTRCYVGGNIGAPLYSCLDREPLPECIVAEVSSFQLECSGGFRPDIGLLLNCSPDHLDRHGSMDRYFEAKMRLFSNQRKGDVAILSGVDPLCRRAMEALRQTSPATILHFGFSEGDTACCTGNSIRLSKPFGEEEYDVGQTSLTSSIDLLNCGAAILAARQAGCPKEIVDQGLRTFSPLPHRLEEVGRINGVRYVNDSKATNTGAVVAALKQFTSGVLLIAGGRDKGDDFRLLRDQVREKVKRLILLGEAAKTLGDCLGDLAPVEFVKDMTGAVETAARYATNGDVVLLSPACASFDMFNSYGHRGEAFREAVQTLLDRGDKDG